MLPTSPTTQQCAMSPKLQAPLPHQKHQGGRQASPGYCSYPPFQSAVSLSLSFVTALLNMIAQHKVHPLDASDSADFSMVTSLNTITTTYFLSSFITQTHTTATHQQLVTLHHSLPRPWQSLGLCGFANSGYLTYTGWHTMQLCA